jgi:hypothetical protein
MDPVTLFLLGTGATVFFGAGVLPESYRALAKLAGLGLAVAGGIRVVKSLSLPGGGGVVQGVEDLLLGAERPEVEKVVVTPAPKVPPLAPPKTTNLLKLAGSITMPQEGGSADRGLFKDRYPMNVRVTNWGPNARKVGVRVTITESYLVDKPNTVSVDAGTLTLEAMGGSGELQLNVPVAAQAVILKAQAKARLYVDGFLVSTVSYSRG